MLTCQHHLEFVAYYLRVFRDILMNCMIIKFLKKYIFVLLAVIIAVGGYLYVCAVGSEYTYSRPDYNTNSKIKNV